MSTPDLVWKIWYWLGEVVTFDNRDGPPEDAPGAGVQVITQYADLGWEKITREHNYVWMHNQWFGCNDFGLYEYLREPGLKVVKFGTQVRYYDYEKVVIAADNDPEMPKRFEPPRLTTSTANRAPPRV